MNAVYYMYGRTHYEANKTKFSFNVQITDWVDAMNETTIDEIHNAFINNCVMSNLWPSFSFCES